MGDLPNRYLPPDTPLMQDLRVDMVTAAQDLTTEHGHVVAEGQPMIVFTFRCEHGHTMAPVAVVGPTAKGWRVTGDKIREMFYAAADCEHGYDDDAVVTCAGCSRRLFGVAKARGFCYGCVPDDGAAP